MQFRCSIGSDLFGQKSVFLLLTAAAAADTVAGMKTDALTTDERWQS